MEDKPYQEKRIGLVSKLKIGRHDRSDELAMTFHCRFGESLVTTLSVFGAEAVRAILDFGAEDIASAKACFVVSLEKDGAFGASCCVGFAGFVK